MLGGAGNVVANISSLGAKCTFLGIIGKDHAGLKISSLLGKLRVHSHLLKLSEYPTIQKTAQTAVKDFNDTFIIQFFNN